MTPAVVALSFLVLPPQAGYKNIFARILAEQQGVDQMVEKVPTLKLFNLNNVRSEPAALAAVAVVLL
eukprot:SAG11_NODE_215_length_12235_cov_11.843276_3_plen_67_part_00